MKTIKLMPPDNLFRPFRAGSTHDIQPGALPRAGLFQAFGLNPHAPKAQNPDSFASTNEHGGQSLIGHAPKAQHMPARGTAPGLRREMVSALKGRDIFVEKTLGNFEKLAV